MERKQKRERERDIKCRVDHTKHETENENQQAQEPHTLIIFPQTFVHKYLHPSSPLFLVKVRRSESCCVVYKLQLVHDHYIDLPLSSKLYRMNDEHKQTLIPYFPCFDNQGKLLILCLTHYTITHYLSLVSCPYIFLFNDR